MLETTLLEIPKCKEKHLSYHPRCRFRRKRSVKWLQNRHHGKANLTMNSKAPSSTVACYLISHLTRKPQVSKETHIVGKPGSPKHLSPGAEPRQRADLS